MGETMSDTASMVDAIKATNLALKGLASVSRDNLESIKTLSRIVEQLHERLAAIEKTDT